MEEVVGLALNRDGQPAQSTCECGCGVKPNSEVRNFVYAIGSVDIRLPDQSIAEEIRIIGGVPIHKQTMRKYYSNVFKRREGRYLARQVCWILKIEGLAAYHIEWDHSDGLDALIECLERDEDDLDLIVGVARFAPVSNGGVVARLLSMDLALPFEKRKFLDALDLSKTDEPASASSRRKSSQAHRPQDMFTKLIQSADNLGDTDQWRALNFLALRCGKLYKVYAEMVGAGMRLVAVKVFESRMQRERRIVDPVFTFQHVETGVIRRFFARVDVTFKFPILVAQFDEYFER